MERSNQRKAIPAETVAEVQRLYAAGLARQAIVTRTGLSYARVYYLTLSASQRQRRREQQSAYRKRQWATNPEYRAAKRRLDNTYSKIRRKEDPEFAERRREAFRRWKGKDPDAYRARARTHWHTYRQLKVAGVPILSPTQVKKLRTEIEAKLKSNVQKEKSKKNNL